MKKNILLILLSFYITCTLVYGQWDYKPGYIITNSNDTIRGFVDLKANNINCRRCGFSTNEASDPKIYLHNDIKEYRIENTKYYVSREVVINSIPEHLFLEYLVDGIVDLYYLAQIDYDYYFLEKNGQMYLLSNEKKVINYSLQSITAARKFGSGEKFVQSSNRYIGMLSIAFNDCPDLKAHINNMDFDYKQFIKITKDYHNRVCTDYQCIDYSRSTQTKVYAEPYIGIINSRLCLKEHSQYEKNTTYIVGINFRILPVKSYYLWNMLIGVNFSKNQLDEDYGTWYDDEWLKADYSVVRFPLSVEYTIPVRTIKPFLVATFTNAIIINKDIAEHYSYERDTQNRLNYGLGMGLGVKYSKGDKGYGILRCDFEHRESYSKSTNIFDYTYANSVIFTLGYGLKL
jgi:hypothetical protein